MLINLYGTVTSYECNRILKLNMEVAVEEYLKRIDDYIQTNDVYQDDMEFQNLLYEVVEQIKEQGL